MKKLLLGLFLVFPGLTWANALPEFKTPYKDIDTVILDFKKVSRQFIESNDHRAVFSTTYLVTTYKFKEALEKRTFDNPEWVDRVVCKFADLYIYALENFENGRMRKVPAPWKKSFQVNRDRSAKLSVQLLLGLNAHINHDLALALYASVPKGVSILRYERDFFRMNKLFEELMPSLFDLLSDLNRDLNKDNKLIPQFIKEKFILTYVKAIRETAWEYGVKLSMADSKRKKRKLKSELEDKSKSYASYIYSLRRLIPEKGL